VTCVCGVEQETQFNGTSLFTINDKIVKVSKSQNPCKYRTKNNTVSIDK